MNFSVRENIVSEVRDVKIKGSNKVLRISERLENAAGNVLNFLQPFQAAFLQIL